MTRTPSSMLPLGTSAAPFRLPDTDGKVVNSADFDGKPLLVMFICNHCPYVKHVAHELRRIGEDYSERVAVVAINSNDQVQYPEDSPEAMRQEKAERGYPFPYLHDASQQVARAYRAACTPDFFLFDTGRVLVYRGQLDGARPGNSVPVTGADLRGALDAVLLGVPVPREQQPSLGCNIKWRPGNEPVQRW